MGTPRKAEPGLQGTGKLRRLLPPARSTFIHPQRLAPVGHRTGLRGRLAARGHGGVGGDAEARVRGPALSSASFRATSPWKAVSSLICRAYQAESFQLNH